MWLRAQNEKTGSTALHEAAFYGRGHFVELFILAGADLHARDALGGQLRSVVPCTEQSLESQ